MNFLSDFGVQPILLAAQVVNFLILLFILKKFLYGPILKVLKNRQDKITESLKQAEEIERKLAETNEKVDKLLEKALEEGRKIVDDSNKAGAVLLEETQVKVSEILEKANDQALQFKEVERVRLMQEVRENLADLVVLALEKVTGKTLTLKEKNQILEKSIKSLS